MCDVDCENNQKLSTTYKDEILNSKESVLIVFCQTHNLKEVVPFLETVNKRFIVVSHNSDGAIQYNRCERWFDYQWKPISNIIAWYSQNVDVVESNISCIPVAVENGYVFNPEVKQKLMFKLALSQKEKDDKVFLCFNPDTNKEDRYGALKYFSDKDYAVIKDGYNNIDLAEPYFTEMAKHKYVISPDGNGLDTIRTWEAIYIGCIPVVKRHVFTNEMSLSVPIIIVDDWSEITPEFLSMKYEELKNTDFDYNCLKMSYWKEKIMNTKKNACIDSPSIGCFK